MKRKRNFSLPFCNLLAVTVCLLLCSANAFAKQTPHNFNFEGTLTDSSGNPLKESGISIKVQYFQPSTSCLLYEESFTGIDTSNTNGQFNIILGGGTANTSTDGLNTSPLNFADMFKNHATLDVDDNTGCSGADYTPNDGDSRDIKVTVTSSAAPTGEAFPVITVGSAPTSFYAETLQGKTPSDFLQPSSGDNFDQAKMNALFTGGNYNVLLDIANGGGVDLTGQNMTLADPTAANHAATKNYSDIHLGGQDINGTPSTNGQILVWSQDNTRWEYSNAITSTSATFGADVDMGGFKITNLNTAAPTADGDAANKKYVDDQVAAYLPIAGGQLNSHLTLDAQSEVRFEDNGGVGAKFVGFKAPAAVTADYTMTLPPAVGGSGQVLQTTDTTGTLAWVTPSSTDSTKVLKTGDTMTGDLSFDGARSIGVNNHPTTGNAGNNLVINAGAPALVGGNNDQDGGTLQLRSGTSTGTGESKIEFQTAKAAAGSGDAANVPATKMTIFGNGFVGIGKDSSPLSNLHVHRASGLESAATFTNTKTTTGFRVGINNETDPDAILRNTNDTNMLFYTNNSEQMRIDKDGKVGIGTDDPKTDLEVSKINSNTKLRVANYDGGSADVDRPSIDVLNYSDNNSSESVFRGGRARGTVASPSAVITDDNLVSIVGTGQKSTTPDDVGSAGSINIHAAEGFSGSSSPGYITFLTTPNSSTIPVERMRIDKNGNVYVRNTVRYTDDDTNFAAIQSPSNLSGDYTLTLPPALGTAGQILSTDASGNLSWITQSSGADNLGNHEAGQPIDLNGHRINNDGVGTKGLGFDATGNADFAQNLTVTGNTTHTGTTTHTGATTHNSDVTINTQGDIRLADSAGGEYVAIQAPGTVGTNYTLTLPPALGTAGQILSTDALGNLSWITQSSGADNLGNHEAGQPIDLNGHRINNDGVGTKGLGFDATGNADFAQNLTVTGNTTHTGTTTHTGATTHNSDVTINTQGDIRLADSAGGEYVAIQAPGTVGTNYTLTLPPALGTAGQILSTDASGNLSWSTPSASDATKLPLTGGTLTGALTINAQNDARFADADSSNYAAIKAPTVIGTNYTLTLPTGLGTAGQVLSTDAAGNLSWSTPSASDSTKVLKTGDTMTGTLTLPTNGLVAGTNQLVLANGNVGIGDTNPQSALKIHDVVSNPVSATVGSLLDVDFDVTSNNSNSVTANEIQFLVDGNSDKTGTYSGSNTTSNTKGTGNINELKVVNSAITHQTTAGTTNDLITYNSFLLGFGAGSITNFTGLNVETQLSVATPITNAHGVKINLPSGVGSIAKGYGVKIETVTGSTNAWAIHSNSSAKTYLNGNVGIGVENPSYKLDVDGTFNVEGISVFNDSVSINAGTSPNGPLDVTGGYAYLPAPNSAPGDGTMVNGQYSIYTNNSANTVHIKVRDPGGDIYTKEIGGQGEDWREVGTGGNPSFVPPWVATPNGDGYEAPAFYKADDGRVYLKGAARPGANTTNCIFILPAGYRPSRNIMFRVARSTGSDQTIMVRGDDVSGTKGCVGPPSSMISGGQDIFLDSISFRAD